MMDVRNRVNVCVVDMIEKEYGSNHHVVPIKLQINEETRELVGTVIVDTTIAGVKMPDEVRDFQISKKLDDLSVSDLDIFNDINTEITLLISVSKCLDCGTPIPGSTYLKVHRHTKQVELLDVFEIGSMFYGSKMRTESRKVKLTDKMFTTLAADLSVFYLVGVTEEDEYVILYSTRNPTSSDLILLAEELKGTEVTCLITDKIDHVIYKNNRKLIGPIISSELVRVM